MPLGYLTLVLHAHLPYVRHPEYDDFLEEDWLYEAITETYIPLLEVFDGLERDGVDWRLTMSITPTLAGMLADPLLQYRYVRHIDNLIALAGKELEAHPLAARVSSPRRNVHEPLHALPRHVRQAIRPQLAQRFPAFLRDGQAGDHHLLRHAWFSAADEPEPAGDARADRSRRPRVRAPFRPAAARHLAARMRLRRRRRRLAGAQRHSLLFHRYAWRSVRQTAAAVRHLRPHSVAAQAASIASAATPNRPSRCGAPSKVIRAITSTASSIATSASTSITNISSRTCTRWASAITPASNTSRSRAGPKTSSRTIRRSPSIALRNMPATSCSIARSRSNGSAGR